VREAAAARVGLAGQDVPARRVVQPVVQPRAERGVGRDVIDPLAVRVDLAPTLMVAPGRSSLRLGCDRHVAQTAGRGRHHER
jgi:hypothetical protein